MLRAETTAIRKCWMVEKSFREGKIKLWWNKTDI